MYVCVWVCSVRHLTWVWCTERESGRFTFGDDAVEYETTTGKQCAEGSAVDPKERAESMAGVCVW